MSKQDREVWNERYRSRAQRHAVAPFAVAAAEWFPAGGHVIDIAGGAGRNAVWLAAQGFAVTLVDVSDVAVSLADGLAAEDGVEITTIVRDLDSDGLPDGRWDAALIHRYLNWDLLDTMADALTPGGVLAFCQPTTTNLERNDRPGRRFLLRPGELGVWIAERSTDYEVIRYEENWSPEGRHEARLIAARN